MIFLTSHLSESHRAPREIQNSAFKIQNYIASVRDILLICHGLRLTIHVLRFPAYEQKVVLEPKLPHKSQYKHNVN
jgi:hypothetical protein